MLERRPANPWPQPPRSSPRCKNPNCTTAPTCVPCRVSMNGRGINPPFCSRRNIGLPSQMSSRPPPLEFTHSALGVSLSSLLLPDGWLLSYDRIPTCVVAAQEPHPGSKACDGHDAPRDTALRHHAWPNRTPSKSPLHLLPPLSIHSSCSAYWSGRPSSFSGDRCTYPTFASIEVGPFPIFTRRDNKPTQLFRTPRMCTIVYRECPMYALHPWSRCAAAFDVISVAAGWIK